MAAAQFGRKAVPVGAAPASDIAEKRAAFIAAERERREREGESGGGSAGIAAAIAGPRYRPAK